MRAKNDRDYLQNGLATAGAPPLTRALDVGDMTWVAKLHDQHFLARHGAELHPPAATQRAGDRPGPAGPIPLARRAQPGRRIDQRGVAPHVTPDAEARVLQQLHGRTDAPARAGVRERAVPEGIEAIRFAEQQPQVVDRRPIFACASVWIPLRRRAGG